jgi:hypothetical protein
VGHDKRANRASAEIPLKKWRTRERGTKEQEEEEEEEEEEEHRDLCLRTIEGLPRRPYFAAVTSRSSII